MIRSLCVHLIREWARELRCAILSKQEEKAVQTAVADVATQTQIR